MAPGNDDHPFGLTLDRLGRGIEARVRAVDSHAAGLPSERTRQLADLGFVPGEALQVVAAAWPGDDPIVVAVAGSRFALRRAEAACIAVQERT